jgi:hypothetical protein
MKVGTLSKIRVACLCLATLLLADTLLRAWYWSMLDMHLYNMYSDLFNHGHPDWVDDAEFLTAACGSLMVSIVLVMGVDRLWRRLRGPR